MDKSNKTQINLTKRNFLKQIPIFFWEALRYLHLDKIYLVHCLTKMSKSLVSMTSFSLREIIRGMDRAGVQTVCMKKIK